MWGQQGLIKVLSSKIRMVIHLGSQPRAWSDYFWKSSLQYLLRKSQGQVVLDTTFGDHAGDIISHEDHIFRAQYWFVDIASRQLCDDQPHKKGHQRKEKHFFQCEGSDLKCVTWFYFTFLSCFLLMVNFLCFRWFLEIFSHITWFTLAETYANQLFMKNGGRSKILCCSCKIKNH